ncbi:MAG: anti-sigma factor family protein [Planctomycetota bacterium]|jgi:predicted anti-sigma-YlaC factor YlaD
MSCRKATQLISESMDRRLTRGEKVALCLHLACCGTCRRFRTQITMVRTLLRRCAGRLESPVEPADDAYALPEDARERIRQALVETG